MYGLGGSAHIWVDGIVSAKILLKPGSNEWSQSVLSENTGTQKESCILGTPARPSRLQCSKSAELMKTDGRGPEDTDRRIRSHRSASGGRVFASI